MKNIIEHILEAREEAIRKGIEANTILINDKVAYCNGLYLKDDVSSNPVGVCPQIFGLKIEYTSKKLPLNANFCLFKREIAEDLDKKAINIIRNKRVNIQYIKVCETYQQYQFICSYGNEINEEEFSILKGVIGNGLE